MENVWNGAFSPTLSKSIGSTTFIPLHQMTPADWRLLDWEALNNTPKNDIVEAALKDQIAGFVKFNFVRKGNARDGYLQPVIVPDLDDLDSLMSRPEFKNYGDKDEPLKDATVAFDRALTRVVTAAMLVGLVPLLPKMFKEEIPKEIEQYIREIVNGDVTGYDDLDMMLTWAFSVLQDHDIEWLEEWAQEAEEILGDAEDKGLT